MASEFRKVPKADLDQIIHKVSIEEPEYTSQDRLNKLFEMLKGKAPDFPEKEKFLQQLVTEYPQTFHLDGERLSVTDAIQHHINYEGPPLWHRQRPIPQAKLPGLLKGIDKLVLHGSIGASDSPYNFQTVPVYKHGTDQDGQRPIRLTVDLSPLNRLTSRDRVTIPTWDEIAAKLGGSKIFSKVDLKSAFHQIGLDEESQRKTAFSVGPRRYQFLTCPQGLSNSPSSLIRLIALVLGECEAFCLPYMDDILIFSSSEEEHEQHLLKVFECLARARLQISLEKSIFFTTAVEFLGFIVSSEGIQPDPAKL